jgi:putative FmdB family regulatory protein
MPIYEYQCQRCGQRSEHMQRVADPPLTVCESCGGELKRLISAPAVQFKGSGWYVTDYAGKKGGGGGRKGDDGAGAAKPDAGGESKAADGGATKSEAPAAKKSDD